MNQAKTVLLLLILAILGGGLYFLTTGQEAPPSPIPPAATPDRPEVSPAQPRAAQAPQPSAPKTDRKVVEMDPASADQTAPQGVKGRVLLPNGAPAVGVPVYLTKNLSSDPIGTWLANRTGRVIPPIASSVTGPDGRFALGVRDPTDIYDLRVVPEDYPELDHRSIKLHEEDWYDTKDLILEQGSVVYGRVTDETTGAPVQNAVVSLVPTNLAHQMLAAPGRENGLVVAVDSSGGFRFQAAPRQGTISLSAEADGYARVEQTNLAIQPDQPNEFNLQLPRGLPIAGIVQDPKGVPIAGARVVATAISNKIPQTGEGMSGSDGRFRIPALRDGPYQLTASAPLYSEKTEKPVLAGDEQVVLTLEQQGSARVRVLDRQGRPVRSFTLSLKRSFPKNPIGIGNVPEFRDVRIMPPDFDGDFATVRGIPNGDFVFQITAQGHARTLSEPFTVLAGGTVPEVTVHLTLGGVLTGRVLDGRGNPVSGATVSTDINGGLAADSEFFKIFAQFMPEKITKTSTRTDRAGRYRLPLLAFGDYMIRATHPQYCEGVALDLKVESETDIVVPDITLQHGTIIEGIATQGGQPRGQVKITIGPPMDQTQQLDPSGKPKAMFMATAISSGDGHYRFLKRVPPGTYAIHASAQAGDNNPFVTLIQMKQTERTLVVPPGQERMIQNFDIPLQ
ncbi:MAG: hypothetical protein Fur0037_20600 [Planctomycetota bacterium]